MKNKIIAIGILTMLFYSHAPSPISGRLGDSPFEPYEIAKGEKIEQYSKFVSPFRGEETELFLARIYGLSVQYGLDFDIAIRWLYTESRFNPKAVSLKGAIGICQLMPGTAKLIADIIDYPEYNLLNENNNLNLGFAFLSLLLTESDYNYEKALARYYAGPNWNYYVESRYVRFIIPDETVRLSGSAVSGSALSSLKGSPNCSPKT
ncbi:MAG: lytic transglycosylase domain-containing protein, partial [bacterium]|nr:lytic transglycosylase domain-containing protein [bacterium]